MAKVGKNAEALDIIMKDLPLPGTIGRICPHPCEDSCRRMTVDEAIAIPRHQAFRGRRGRFGRGNPARGGAPR